MRIRAWAIGLFIILGFGLFTATLFLIGDRQKAFHKHVTLYTEFADLGGITEGAKIRVSGFDTGQVKKIRIPQGPAEKFRLELQIEERAQKMIRKDSRVSVETAGVVGDKFVLIRKGSTQAQEVQPGDTLPSKEPFDMSAVMDKATLLLSDVHSTVNDLHGRLDTAIDSVNKTVGHADGLITGLRPDIQRITGQINTLVGDLNAGKGPAGLLLKDAATREQLQSTMANVTNASGNLRQVSEHADQLVTDVQSRQLVARMQTTLDNVGSLTQRLDGTVKQAFAEDSLGQDAAVNMRETISNLNRSTANLAEDTEALKHNFFLRGFFKKRGFYNLDQISRDDYLKACEREKVPPDRKWLAASTLLTTDGDGHETLSDSGRRLVDEQLAPIVDDLPDHLVVIEGYASGPSPSDEFVRSRKRADLVRRYLEVRFRLKHNHLGIVPLRDKPPAQAGRASWDGAAIAILPARNN